MIYKWILRCLFCCINRLNNKQIPTVLFRWHRAVGLEVGSYCHWKCQILRHASRLEYNLEITYIRVDYLIKKWVWFVEKIITYVNVKNIIYGLFSHLYSQISYGIIFWGLPSSMRNVFIIQKKQLGLFWDWVQGVLVERISKSWIYFQFFVYVFMPCYFLLLNS